MRDDFGDREAEAIEIPAAEIDELAQDFAS
jgi:hypothetical protein